jgi:hypothetical protein
MTKNEIGIIIAFLDELDEEFGNAGSNDMWLKNTEENRNLCIAAEKEYAQGDSEEISLYKGKIGTNDNCILQYLRNKLADEYGISEANLTKIR